MKKLILIFLLLVLFIPAITKAAGLVPCGGPEPEKPCTACDLLVLLQNVLHFALTIAFLIVVIFAIVGGFRWILSGGNEENIKAGQKTLSSALIGLVIILCAWLIVNTVFWLVKTIGGEDYTGTGALPWFQLECTYPESNTNNGGSNGDGGGDGGGNGDGNNNGGLNEYGAFCGLHPGFSCHLTSNCDFSKAAPIDHADCPPEGDWTCCIAKEGVVDPPLPTPPTTESTGCPNNGPKVQGTCFKYTCRPPCDNPNGPLQCLPTSYNTEPMCLKEYKEYICPGHELDTCDWQNSNSCNNN